MVFASVLGISGFLTLLCTLSGAYHLIGNGRGGVRNLNVDPVAEASETLISKSAASFKARAVNGRVNLDDTSLVSDQALSTSENGSFAKRALDICASAALLIFTLPVLVVTALLIKLESPGPIFYKQKRVGLNGKTFQIFKFRSMTVNAEKDGAVWASQNDSRVTRIGRIIRLIRVDEIPQVINIFLGQMSFVGPRPERPEFTQLLSPELPLYDRRHNVKPGLTGWAQINYHYGGSVKDAAVKLEYDLYYIKKYSVFFDVWIMLKTVRVALFGLGSR